MLDNAIIDKPTMLFRRTKDKRHWRYENLLIRNGKHQSNYLCVGLGNKLVWNTEGWALNLSTHR